MNRTRRYRAALVWQIALAAYMQLISWVPLGRWNYQPCCPTGLEAARRGTLTRADAFGVLAFLIPMALFLLGVRLARRIAMWLSLVALAVWLGLQVWGWWVPYVVGASDRWTRTYARAFAYSTAILPRWGNHLPPDAMHVVLQALLAGSLITGIRALVRHSDP